MKTTVTIAITAVTIAGAHAARFIVSISEIVIWLPTVAYCTRRILGLSHIARQILRSPASSQPVSISLLAARANLLTTIRKHRNRPQESFPRNSTRRSSTPSAVRRQFLPCRDCRGRSDQNPKLHQSANLYLATTSRFGTTRTSSLNAGPSSAPGLLLIRRPLHQILSRKLACRADPSAPAAALPVIRAVKDRPWRKFVPAKRIFTSGRVNAVVDCPASISFGFTARIPSGHIGVPVAGLSNTRQGVTPSNSVAWTASLAFTMRSGLAQRNQFHDARLPTEMRLINSQRTWTGAWLGMAQGTPLSGFQPLFAASKFWKLETPPADPLNPAVCRVASVSLRVW